MACNDVVTQLFDVVLAPKETTTGMFLSLSFVRCDRHFTKNSHLDSWSVRLEIESFSIMKVIEKVSFD